MEQIYGWTHKGSFFWWIGLAHESMGLTIALRQGKAILKAGQVHTATANGRKNNSAQWGSQWVDQDVESKCMGMEIAIYELDGK